MKSAILLPLLGLITLLPARPTDAAEATSQKRQVIGVIPKGATHAFWKSIHAGAVKAATELGNVDILWKGPLKEDDRESQIKVVEDMVTRRVNGIVLAPLDDVALRPAVNDAARNQIPVVIIDSDLKTDKYVSFIATDNYVGGTRGGAHLAKLLNGKARIVMLRYAEGSASTMKREQGFLDEIKKHPGIEVVSANRYGGATAAEAQTAGENLLAPLRKADGSLNIDGIFCPNESTTFGMLRALQNGGWAGKVTFVGFDSSEMLVKALEKREIHGLVLQDPFNMGYQGVHKIVAHLKGQPVDKRIDTGSQVASPDNMKDPVIKVLLEPNIKRWLKEE
jgi:ribose transport system substrate-binding protein